MMGGSDAGRVAADPGVATDTWSPDGGASGDGAGKSGVATLPEFPNGASPLGWGGIGSLPVVSCLLMNGNGHTNTKSNQTTIGPGRSLQPVASRKHADAT